VLEEELGPLSALDRQFCEVIALSDLGRFTRPYEWCGNGAPPHARVWLMHAFIAKSVYQFPTTAALRDGLRSRPMLRRLCGWESAGEVPSEPTFSRAFAAFAEGELPQRIHAQLVQRHAGPKLVGHLSRDATAIEAPERPRAKPAPEPVAPRPRGRPRKGETRPPPPLKRLELQGARTLAENLADLPRACDVGTKCNSKGYKTSWSGYKLHLDTADGDLPVSAVLTSASVHDSQELESVLLPPKTLKKVFADSAYRSVEQEKRLRDKGYSSHIHERAYRNRPLTEKQKATNTVRSKTRVRIEHIFGHITHSMNGCFVRTIGIARAEAKIGMENLAYNISRFTFLMGAKAAAT